MTIIRTGKGKQRKVIAESNRTGVSWTNNPGLGDGQRFAIITLPDAKGHMYRVELSEDEITRLNNYRRVWP